MDPFYHCCYVFVCHTVLSAPCSLVITCWEKADFLALSYVMFFVFLSLFHTSWDRCCIWCIDSCFFAFFQTLKTVALTLTMCVHRVSEDAKIRNRYNQGPHMTQDTNGILFILCSYD